MSKKNLLAMTNEQDARELEAKRAQAEWLERAAKTEAALKEAMRAEANGTSPRANGSGAGATEPPKVTKEDLENAVGELAKLTELEREIVVADYAKRLSVPVPVLRSAAKKAHRHGGGEAGAGMYPYWNVEPWPKPVAPAAVLARVQGRLLRHVFMPEDAATAAALWVMLAWVHEAAVHSPILLVSSPEAECGKSTLLDLIKFLAPRGFLFVDVRAPVLFRVVEKWHPTLLVDEADDAFKSNVELRTVINSGWTRGTGVPRCNPDTLEPEVFETFGPKAIGLKGLRVPETTLSRSIVIDMERKFPGDEVADFAHIDDADLAETRQQLARFANDNIDALADAKPMMPEGFTNRLAANWKMMLAIGELCGAGDKARASAAGLSRRADEASLGVELLRDIKAIFETGPGLARISSEVLVLKLTQLEGRPWSEMPFSGKPITQLQLAKLLKGFKVVPKPMRLDGDHLLRGYTAEMFEKAWRYIPAETETEAESEIDA